MLFGLGDAFTPSPLKRPREEEVTREIRENEKEIRWVIGEGRVICPGNMIPLKRNTKGRAGAAAAAVT